MRIAIVGDRIRYLCVLKRVMRRGDFVCPYKRLCFSGLQKLFFSRRGTMLFSTRIGSFLYEKPTVSRKESCAFLKSWG